jgi:hypothetical protein
LAKVFYLTKILVCHHFEFEGPHWGNCCLITHYWRFVLMLIIMSLLYYNLIPQIRVLLVKVRWGYLFWFLWFVVVVMIIFNFIEFFNVKVSLCFFFNILNPFVSFFSFIFVIFLFFIILYFFYLFIFPYFFSFCFLLFFISLFIYFSFLISFVFVLYYSFFYLFIYLFLFYFIYLFIYFC